MTCILNHFYVIAKIITNYDVFCIRKNAIHREMFYTVLRRLLRVKCRPKNFYQ